MDYVQLAMPLGLIVWLALWPMTGRARWAQAIAVLGVVAAFALLGQWRWPSAYVPYGLAGLAASAVVLGRRRKPARGEPGGWRGGMLMLVVAGVAFAGAGLAVKARVRPPATLALDMPFIGRALVTQGGGNVWINAQQAVLDADSPRLTRWRGAGQGVVMEAVDGWGRATGAALTVVAPCAGHVVLVTHDVRLGQAVVLDCAGVWVVLGGMESVQAKGDLGIGAPLGRAVVLSVHAQLPGVAAHPFSGDGIAVTLGDRYGVRGVVLHGVAGPQAAAAMGQTE